MCAPFVWLSYVQPSRGKTFAYLRSFALLYEATVLGRRDEPNGGGEEEEEEQERTFPPLPPASLQGPPFTSQVRHPPPYVLRETRPS